MNKLLVCLLAILLSNIANGQDNVIIKNDTIYANRQSHYDILRAIANYHKLQLELIHPMEAYNNRYTLENWEIKKIDITLKILNALIGMEHVLQGNKLIVGLSKKRSHIHNPVIVKNDTLYADGSNHYDILQAVADYHKLQLVPKSPRGSFNYHCTISFTLKNVHNALATLKAITGMKYLVKNGKLMAGYTIE